MDDAKVRAGVAGGWKEFLYANRTSFCFLERVGIVVLKDRLREMFVYFQVGSSR